MVGKGSIFHIAFVLSESKLREKMTSTSPTPSSLTWAFDLFEGENTSPLKYKPLPKSRTGRSAKERLSREDLVLTVLLRSQRLLYLPRPYYSSISPKQKK